MNADDKKSAAQRFAATSAAIAECKAKYGRKTILFIGDSFYGDPSLMLKLERDRKALKRSREPEQ